MNQLDSAMTPMNAAVVTCICILVVISCLCFLRRLGKHYPIYRHNKTGTEYAVMHIGKFENSTKDCIIYAAVDELKNSAGGVLPGPTIWVRDYNEFFDAGRFTYSRSAFI